MSSFTSVVAAIPNYNMAPKLETLLLQVLEQGYAEVYVLDDASTDDSRDVVDSFGGEITLVAGTENLSSAGNRNRIINALKHPALIHFLDADVELITDNIVEQARESMSGETIGLAGGLVLNSAGEQSVWNYGPRQCLHTDIGGDIQFLGQKYPGIARTFRRYTRLMDDWPNIEQSPARREIFWLLEANLFIDSAKFEKLGGFDPAVRDHDIQDLALRSQRAGLVSVFDPSIAVLQTDDLDVRGYNRLLSMWKAEWYIARKNGARNWFLPDGNFRPTYNRIAES